MFCLNARILPILLVHFTNRMEKIKAWKILKHIEVMSASQKHMFEEWLQAMLTRGPIFESDVPTTLNGFAGWNATEQRSPWGPERRFHRFEAIPAQTPPSEPLPRKEAGSIPAVENRQCANK